MEGSNFFWPHTERFIGEVEKYPEIWNIGAEEYHNRIKKRNSWNEICRVFCEEFDSKDEEDQSEICKKFMNKWRNIKDNFKRTLKQKNNSGKRYIYAQHLSFLQKVARTTDNQASLVFEDDQDELKSLMTNTPTPEEETVYNRTPRLDHNTKTQNLDMDSGLGDFMEVSTLSSTGTAVPEPNADRYFFESILPYVNAFTEDQKLDFRCEVLNVIKRLREPQQNLSSQQSYVGHPFQPNLNEACFSTLHSPNRFPQMQTQSSNYDVKLQPVSPSASTSSSEC